MRKLYILILFLPLTISVRGQTSDIWQVVRKDFLPAVVQIFNNSPNNSGSGTGFILCDSGMHNFYLVTNKHVIGVWKQLGDSVIISDKIQVVFYGANLRPYNAEILLRDKNGSALKNVKTHPDRDVDIAVIKITNTYTPGDTVKYSQRAIPTSFLKSYKELATSELGLSIGSSIFAIGYPLGVKNISTNEPIVKHGYISSDISRNFSFPSKGHIFNGKIFLVDGLITHGNSGGPVITPQLIYVPMRLTNNFIIGIISQGFDGSGISLIYSSDYIREVIDMFSH